VRAVDKRRQKPGRPGTGRRAPRAGEAEVFLHDCLLSSNLRILGGEGEGFGESVPEFEGNFDAVWVGAGHR